MGAGKESGRERIRESGTEVAAVGEDVIFSSSAASTAVGSVDSTVTLSSVSATAVGVVATGAAEDSSAGMAEASEMSEVSEGPEEGAITARLSTAASSTFWRFTSS